MLQSFEPSQTKERPRAILGRLQVSARPPSKYESQCGYNGFSICVSAMVSGLQMGTTYNLQETR